MHIYAFGSISRGDVSQDSDIDLLAIVKGYDARFNPEDFSIYSYKRIEEIWDEGNPFAWHLSLQSKPIFLSDEIDFLKNLGKPKPYMHCLRDCEKFLNLFCDARSSMLDNSVSLVFDLSTIFLSIRNIATCFSLGTSNRPDFSRSSALRLEAKSLQLPKDVYRIFEKARILSTRGRGEDLTSGEVETALKSLSSIHEWMTKLVTEARNERIC
ncbi:MAG TPA: nucleotidyltransferase domain-containing protein [Alphaproteobacteria bacterium]|nr:nucleotidyltransferase domain-containing protein [Alphaproteobacteria bacterium]